MILRRVGRKNFIMKENLATFGYNTLIFFVETGYLFSSENGFSWTCWAAMIFRRWEFLMDSPRNTSPRKHQEITICKNKIQVENRLFITLINLKSI